MTIYDEIIKTKSFIPTGKQGEWAVEKFTVSKSDAKLFNLRQMINNRGREILPGNYTKLTHQGTIVMSDTPAEIQDQIYFTYVAHGNILINGLGLGLVVQGLMLDSTVKHITIIEISPEVISLVGKHLEKRYGDKITIINADAFTWKPPKGRNVYTFAWHDIWETICGDHWPEMKRLHRKYAQKAREQYSWCREEIRRAARI